MFLHVCVILFTGRVGVLSQHALQVVSQHALHQVSRGCPVPWWWSIPWGGGCLLPGEEGLLPWGTAPGGVCSWRVCSREGAWWRPPGRLLLRAVRILLECIPVLLYVCLYLFRTMSCVVDKLRGCDQETLDEVTQNVNASMKGIEATRDQLCAGSTGGAGAETCDIQSLASCNKPGHDVETVCG